MYYSASSIAAPRLNCSCICYGFDLRGYVPGAVLRLPDSMELFYPRDQDSLTPSSCCMGSCICKLLLWYVLLAIRIWLDSFWSLWSYVFMAYIVLAIIDIRPSFLIFSTRRGASLCPFVLLQV